MPHDLANDGVDYVALKRAAARGQRRMDTQRKKGCQKPAELNRTAID